MCYIKFLSSLLLFGSNGIIAGLIGMNSYEIVTFRTMIGSVVLAVIFLAAGGRLSFREHAGQFAAVGASGAAMGISWLFLYEAYRYIGVGKATLCYYFGPVIVMALSPFIFGEKIRKRAMIALAAALCGLFLITDGVLNSAGSSRGVVYGLMSAVMHALMLIFNKSAKDIGGFENSLVLLCFSFLTAGTFSVYMFGVDLSAALDNAALLLLLGAVNTGLGCYLYFSSIGSLSVQTIAVCGYIEPVSAVILSVLFLAEPMSFRQAAGAALVIGGAVLGEMRGLAAKE